jgi:hypothetical protein
MRKRKRRKRKRISFLNIWKRKENGLTSLKLKEIKFGASPKKILMSNQPNTNISIHKKENKVDIC